LEYNLQKGVRYKQKMQIDMKINQQVIGQEMNVNSVTGTETTYIVKESTNESITMDMVYDRIRTSMNVGGTVEGMSGGTELEMDSEEEGPIASSTDMSALYKAMIGIPVLITITKKGEVQSIRGVEKLSDAMLKSIERINIPTDKKQFAAQFTQQFNEASLKQSFERFSFCFPDRDVSVGDSWNIIMDVQYPYELSINMNMALKEVKDNIATLEGKGDVSTPAEGIVKKERGIDVKMNLTGTQSCILKIDLITGWPVSAEMVLEMEGESEAMGMKIPLSVKTNTKITD
jgi:hypothetical protein